MGVQFYMSPDALKISRKMYGPGDYAGDLGGLFTVVKIVCGAIVGWGGRARLEAVVTELLYKDSNLARDEQDDFKRLSDPEAYFKDKFKDDGTNSHKTEIMKEKTSKRIRPPLLWEW